MPFDWLGGAITLASKTRGEMRRNGDAVFQLVDGFVPFDWLGG